LLRIRLISVGFLIIVLIIVGSVSSLLCKRGFSSCNAYNRSNLIRLHVIANSDAPIDQTLKLKVRDRILKVCEALLLKVENPRRAETLLRSRLDRLAAAAQAELVAQQRPMPVKVQLGEFQFPTKHYSFGTLTAGKYKGLRVVIGSGKGCNWWCVLYPPFCLLAPDAPTLQKLPDKQVKVTYKLAFFEKLVHNKGLTMNRFWKNWGKSFGML
jgi:stage II sporulation protein R